MGETATWMIRFFGGRDPATSWPAVYFGCGEGDFDPDDFDCDDFFCAYPCVDIKVFMKPISSREIDMPAGRITEERWKMYTAAEIRYRDHILYHGDTFEIETEPIEHYLLGVEKYRDCILIKVN